MRLWGINNLTGGLTATYNLYVVTINNKPTNTDTEAYWSKYMDMLDTFISRLQRGEKGFHQCSNQFFVTTVSFKTIVQ